MKHHKWFKFTEIEKQDIIDKYLISNLRIYQIAKIYQCDQSVIRNRLKQWKIEIKPYNKLNKCNEDYFSIIDSPNKAYFLGLMYADGCIRDAKHRQKQLMIMLKSEDEYILQKFKEELDFNGKIYNYKRNKTCKVRGREYKSSDYSKLHISSNKLCNDLIKLGCLPRKTFSCTFPLYNNIPKNLIQFFILGYLDGDGSVYQGKDGKISVVFCGNNIFLQGLRDCLHLNLGLNKNSKIYTNKFNCSYLRYNGNIQGNKLYKFLYTGISIGLNRKRNKFTIS